MNQSTLFALMGLLVVGVFLTGCTPATNQEKSTTQTEETLLSAPDFTVTTTTGAVASLETYLENGKPTIVYFMASWCPTCAKNWPVLEELYNRGDVNILAVSIDPTDTAEVLNKLASENDLSFPMVPGNPQLMLDFVVKEQTTIVIVNPEGKIVTIKSGKMSLEKFDELLAK